jgi:hypothetical protein
MSRARLFRVVLFSLLSAAVWATLVVALARPLGSVLWGGVMAAPVIGLAAGFASALFPSSGIVRRALFSLVSLYAAAAFFGLAMGVYDLALGPNAGAGWQRVPSGVVIQAMLGTLWGLTFGGYLVLFWPLSYANHLLIWRLWTRQPPRQA